LNDIDDLNFCYPGQTFYIWQRIYINPYC